MNDPYRILRISRDATDEEVKQAYRELAKKYHPDRYHNSPLSESASEKMKEINAAYDQIMSERKSDAGYQSSWSGGYESYNNTQNQPLYQRIRELINNGGIEEAEQLLGNVPPTERTSEWFYLSGVLVYQKGWLEEAYNYVGTACRMDPDNVEYQSFYNSIKGQRSGESGGYQPSDHKGCSCLDMLACFACSECCCDCANCLDAF